MGFFYVVRTHLRDMTIVPEMIGYYLEEFSITYKPIKVVKIHL